MNQLPVFFLSARWYEMPKLKTVVDGLTWSMDVGDDALILTCETISQIGVVATFSCPPVSEINIAHLSQHVGAVSGSASADCILIMKRTPGTYDMTFYPTFMNDKLEEISYKLSRGLTNNVALKTLKAISFVRYNLRPEVTFVLNK